jgi:hypothetical protein
MPAGPTATWTAVSPRTAARRHALPLLLCITPALLARGLDLRQVELVTGPLDANLLR